MDDLDAYIKLKQLDVGVHVREAKSLWLVLSQVRDTP